MKTFRRISAAVLAALLLSGTVFAQDKVPSLTYQPIGEKLYRLGDTGYIVESMETFFATPQRFSNIGVYAEQYNKHFPLGENLKKYVYLVESPRSVEITEDMTGENPVFTKIKESYEVTAAGTLALESYTQYLDWFYQTDHHWNYKGSYQGYCDLIDMMFGPEEEKIKPIETVVFSDTLYNGSFSRRVKQGLSTESFAVYRFPESVPYTVMFNGKPTKAFGNADQYFKGKYSRETLANHYSLFYGGDCGEAILKTNRPEKKTLLIISNSMDNPLTLLLLQHYDAIYVIDPRYYTKQKRKKLNAEEYIRKNEIDEVLFIGEMTFFQRDPVIFLTKK